MLNCCVTCCSYQESSQAILLKRLGKPSCDPIKILLPSLPNDMPQTKNGQKHLLSSTPTFRATLRGTKTLNLVHLELSFVFKRGNVSPRTEQHEDKHVYNFNWEGEFVVGREYTVSPQEGDRYCLRTLLYNVVAQYLLKTNRRSSKSFAKLIVWSACVEVFY